MTRLITHTSKILQGLYNSGAEELLPVSVDGCARSQRLPRHKEPFCQRQPIAGRAGRKSGEQSWDIWSERWTCLRQKVSAFELQSLSCFVRRLLQHHWRFDTANLLQSASEG